MNKKIIKKDWNLANLWNAVAYKENRPMIKRNYIYASELGSPYIDRFLKMKATPYTNPPNDRSLRKFLSGNLWEFVVKQILVSCGVFRHEEVKADGCPYSGCLDVHGRLDFIAGGYVDKDEAMANIVNLNLPEFLVSIAHRIINELAGGHLEEKVLELKAVSSFAMDMIERRKGPVPNHTLQGYHYDKFTDYPAEISYICKDDCRMAQFKINCKETEPIYKNDVEEMTEYFKKNKKPPLAPLAGFDYGTAKFSKNLGVEYSPYLTMLYGFKSPEEYRDAVKFVVGWNRTMDRFLMVETGHKTPTGKPMLITPKNLEVKEQITKAGYKFDDLLEAKKEFGISNDDEE